MKWGIYFGLASLATIKFMFAPAGGVALLSFWETYFSCVAGALVCSVVFFFGANFFMQRAQRRYAERNVRRLAAGKEMKIKKKFTPINKSVVRIKRSLGMVVISLWAPYFLSVPLGAIIVAKFYRKRKLAYPLIVLGIFANGFLSTSIAYLFV